MNKKEELINILKEIEDEASHSIGTDASDGEHREISIQNAREIQRLSRKGRRLVDEIK